MVRSTMPSCPCKTWIDSPERASQRRAVPSSEPVMIRVPSELKAMARTQPTWPLSCAIWAPVANDARQTLPEASPIPSTEPSGLAPRQPNMPKGGSFAVDSPVAASSR